MKRDGGGARVGLRGRGFIGDARCACVCGGAFVRLRGARLAGVRGLGLERVNGVARAKSCRRGPRIGVRLRRGGERRLREGAREFGGGAIFVVARLFALKRGVHERRGFAFVDGAKRGPCGLLQERATFFGGNANPVVESAASRAADDEQEEENWNEAGHFQSRTMMARVCSRVKGCIEFIMTRNLSLRSRCKMLLEKFVRRFPRFDVLDKLIRGLHISYRQFFILGKISGVRVMQTFAALRVKDAPA